MWNVKNHILSEDFEGWKIFCDHSAHKHGPLPHKIISYQWRGGLTTKKKQVICSDQVVSLWRDISLNIQFCNRADGDI